jgi:hypothetical protein
MNPHPLTPREQALIQLYSYCQLGMTPQRFYAKWGVSQEALAKPVQSTLASICSRSISTVRCWFRKGQSYRRPTATDLRHLALMDFLLDHFEQIPETIQQAVCSPKQKDKER